MSLISLKSRLTKNTDEFERYLSSDQSLIFSSSDHEEEWSIELTVGRLWGNVSKESPVAMYEVHEDVGIPAKSSVIIEVNEELRIPNNIYGLIVPKGSLLLDNGILMATTKIEPRYFGKLRILFFNTTNRKKTLNKGSVIASTIFFRTDITLASQQPRTRKDVVATQPSFIKSFFDFSKVNYQWFFTTLIALAALIVSIWGGNS